VLYTLGNVCVKEIEEKIKNDFKILGSWFEYHKICPKMNKTNILAYEYRFLSCDVAHGSDSLVRQSNLLMK
jgi:hypothetical protein